MFPLAVPFVVPFDPLLVGKGLLGDEVAKLACASGAWSLHCAFACAWPTKSITVRNPSKTQSQESGGHEVGDGSLVLDRG